MANDANEVVVGANGRVWVADTDNTAVPDDVATAMDPLEWDDMGFLSEDGATFTEGRDVTDIGAWQSFYPIRRIVTGRTVTIAFMLRQWNKANIEFALGGVVGENGAEYVYTPPEPDALSTKSLTLEWFDGDKSYRLYMPLGIVSETVETNLVRTAAADLPITFSAFDPGLGDPIYSLFTDDPAFATS